MLKIFFSTVLLTGLGLAIAATSPDIGGTPHHGHRVAVIVRSR